MYSWCCGILAMHNIDHINNCCTCGYYQVEERDTDTVSLLLHYFLPIYYARINEGINMQQVAIEIANNLTYSCKDYGIQTSMPLTSNHKLKICVKLVGLRYYGHQGVFVVVLPVILCRKYCMKIKKQTPR